MQITSINTTTIVPLRSNWHVVPSGVFWMLKQEHRAEHWGMYLTKIEATSDGIQQARQGHVSLIIHGRDGRIQQSWDYTNRLDPFD